jgi:gluconokinase
MIVVITGVSGAGKTTVGKLLAESLRWLFYDADDFHSAVNVAKMRRGIPLTDQDRVPWLTAIAEVIRSSDRCGHHAVLACSALRKSYRTMLSAAAGQVHFVFLDVPREVVVERVRQRIGHFMPASQVADQFATLEAPEDALRIDARLAPSAIVDQVSRALAIGPCN